MLPTEGRWINSIHPCKKQSINQSINDQRFFLTASCLLPDPDEIEQYYLPRILASQGTRSTGPQKQGDRSHEHGMRFAGSDVWGEKRMQGLLDAVSRRVSGK